MSEFIPAASAPTVPEVIYREPCQFGSREGIIIDGFGLRFFIDVDVRQSPAPGSVPAVAHGMTVT